jgi:hypothetical protein
MYRDLLGQALKALELSIVNVQDPDHLLEIGAVMQKLTEVHNMIDPLPVAFQVKFTTDDQWVQLSANSVQSAKDHGFEVRSLYAELPKLKFILPAISCPLCDLGQLIKIHTHYCDCCGVDISTSADLTENARLMSFERNTFIRKVRKENND